MKKIIVLILIIAIGVVSYYFYNQNNTQVSTELYEYVKIERGNIKKVVSATGKIIPTSTLILSSEISGKIVEIKKDYNEKINEGDVLAIFDQNPFILNVEETETSVEISKSKLKQKNASLEKAFSKLAFFCFSFDLEISTEVSVSSTFKIKGFWSNIAKTSPSLIFSL